MTLAEAATLAAAAFLAGGINAVAGGGTILTFPALLAWGMPAIAANATSTLALVLGTIGSAWAYRARMEAIRPVLASFGIVSVLGGLAGAWLLTRTPEALFSGMVPWLLLFATALFGFQSALRKLQPASGRLHPHPAALAAQFLVAVYGGYFGAGIGILMLAVFGLMGFDNIHSMNALKTLLSAAINSVAAAWFVATGLVRWPQAVVMTLAAILGYFLAAHNAQRLPELVLRGLVTGIGLAITALLFAKKAFEV